jgi:hypothetical protein
MKVIDGVLFSTEVDLLKIRLDYYKDVVDEFVICEANKNFYGEERDLVYPTIKDSLGSLADKVTYIVCDTFETVEKTQGNPRTWNNEMLLRESLNIRFNDATDDDLLIFSDVDEFYDKSLIAEREKPLSCLMHTSYFYIDYVQWEHTGGRARMGGPQMYQRKQFHNLKNNQFSQFASDYKSTSCLRNNSMIGYKEISQAMSWHLSYLHHEKSIPQKLSTFSHSELLHLKDLPMSYFNEKIRNFSDIFDRPNFYYKVEKLIPDDLAAYFDESYSFSSFSS